MSERAPYSRVYWSIVDDPKFVGIYDDDHHMATWLRLLIAADALWPASCPLPGNARKASVAALVKTGLIDLGTGYRFRIHGLDAERGRRRDAARTPAKRDPDGTQTGPERDWRPGPKPRRDETSLDKPSQRAPARESFKDPLLNEIRAAQIALYGNGNETPIVVQPTPIPTVAEQEREAGRLEALALHERFIRGELAPGEYERLRGDLGKQPDDLTRIEA